MSQLDEGERAKLLDRFGRNFSAGETLYRDGELAESCMLLRSGSVRLQKKIGSLDIHLTVFRDGDLFGEEGLLEGGRRNGTSVAITDGAALRLDKHTFAALLAGHADVANKLVEQLVRRLRSIEGQLENSLLPDHQMRVVNSLLHLAATQHPGVDDDATEDIALNVTPLELASRCLINVDDARRHLQKLQDDGFVAIANERLLLRQPSALERLRRLLALQDEVRRGFP